MGGSVYLVDKSVLPDVYEKVVNAKKLIKEGKVKDGSVVCMIAAGIGYAWAANIIKWGE